MGRILELCAEIAAEADEGEDGLVISPDTWDRFRQDWNDEDIEDAMALVKDSLLQGELAEVADSLSSRLVEVLGGYGTAKAFQEALAGDARISVETLGQVARRVNRLEEILEVFRDGKPPDRTAFDALRRRLADLGLEAARGDDEDAAD